VSTDTLFAALPAVNEKRCRACGFTKPIDAFARKLDGRHSQCKRCVNAKQNAKRYENRPPEPAPPQVLADEKQCTKCKKILPFAAFYFNRKRNQLMSYCRLCGIAASKARAKRPEKPRAFTCNTCGQAKSWGEKVHRHNKCRQCQAAYLRAWRVTVAARRPAHAAVSEKKCSKCKSVKPREAFNNAKSVRGGLSSWCRDCQSTAHRCRGMPEAAYLAMKQEQAGRCAACGVEADRLHVDHDHSDGRIRGLLCR